MLKKFTIWLTCCGVLLPATGWSAPPPTSQKPQYREAQLKTSDVALGDGRMLRGQIVDRQGVGRHGVKINAYRGTQIVASGTTSELGHFGLTMPSGGTYLLTADGNVHLCRAWAPNTAPPGATAGLMIIDGEQTVRGQDLYGWISDHPWLFYTGVAAAIVVPLVVINADDDSSS